MDETTGSTAVSFGTHSRLKALPSEQSVIRKFYCEVLGCRITKGSERADYFSMRNEFFIAVLYDKEALTKEQSRESIWLELHADDVESVRARILQFGVDELDSPDKDHLYFQAPGGQVFRLVGSTEDLSRFER